MGLGQKGEGDIKRVLVTGCGGSAGHNFIRSLRLANEDFYIVGTDMNKYHIKLSRADKNYLVPHYSSHLYLLSLQRIIKREKIDFLHAQPDTEVVRISESRESLKVRLMLPSKEAIKLAQHKLDCINLLRKKGIPSPYSFGINSSYDIKSAIKTLKSEGHKVFWLRAISGAGSRGALPVEDFETAKVWINYWAKKGLGKGQFMMSEFLPKKEYAFQSIWKEGSLITSQARQRIEYLFGSRMPSGQSSTPTIAKTVSNDKVNEIAIAGIKAIDEKPNGIYCVDLKENAQDIPCITEINAGRFFTTSIFFSAAGCNMPYYYVKSAFNEYIPPLKLVNPLPKNLYWIRNIDFSEKLIKE